MRNDELDDLITNLVSIETENPPGNEHPCAEFVAAWFEDRGIDADIVDKPEPERPQVAARIGEGSPTVVLNGHIDVVPAGDRDQWEYDPYAAEIVDGQLYGRGSTDMKSGVACGMLTAATLREEIESGTLDGSLVVHAAMGEETADPGTKTLLEEGYDGDYGVVLEPTGMRTATSEKGLAWYEITVDGQPSHASRPDQGVNAIQQARPVLDALETYDDEVRGRADDLLGTAYATVTMLEAGTKENVLPEEAVITVDRRFLPSESITEIDTEIDTVLQEAAATHDIDVEWERTRTYEAAEIPVDNSLAAVFREHSHDIAGVDPAPWGIQGATDVRNFVNDADIEAITWGPGDLDQAHTTNEHISLEAAATGYDVLTSAVRDLLSTDPTTQ